MSKEEEQGSSDGGGGAVYDGPERRAALPGDLVPVERQSLAPVPFDFAPKSLTEAMELAKMLADSTIVPNDYQGKPGNVLVAIQMGGELGLKPMQAMQNIAVINGRPSLWGDAVLALVRAATDAAGNRILEGIEESYDEATHTALCRVKRRGAQPCERKFSRTDAERAQLLSKPIWKQYEKRMTQMRARSWALRDEFTDVLRGMPIAEEVMDFQREKDVTPPPEQPASRSDQLKARLRPASPFTRDEVVARYDHAKAADEVRAADDIARSFKDDVDLQALRTARERAVARVRGGIESSGNATAEASE